MGVIFHEKSSLEKKLGFPENSEFFEIHDFRQNTPKLVTPRRKFPGIWVPTSPQNARIYGFPGILEPKFRFSPGNFCQNFEFSRNSEIDIFTNSREFWSTKPRKMQEYTGFPEFSSWISDFSREIFTKILNFHDILGWPVTKFPGILVEKTQENARIYGFHGFWGVKFAIFPGILVGRSWHLEKGRYTPGVHLQEYTGFPVPPGAHFGP